MYGIRDNVTRRLLTLHPEIAAGRPVLHVGPYEREPIFAVRRESLARALMRNGEAAEAAPNGTAFVLDPSLERRTLEIVDFGGEGMPAAEAA